MTSVQQFHASNAVPGSHRLAHVLCLCFAAGWAIGAVNSETGVYCLGGVCSVVTVPYYLKVFGERIARNMTVGLFLTIVGVIVPPLLPLVALWGLYCFADKFRRLVANLPLIALGAAAYAATAMLPELLLQSIESHIPQPPRELAILLVALVGGAAFWLVLRLTTLFGSTPTRSAAVMLGASTYLVVFLLTFLIPHVDGDDGET